MPNRTPHESHGPTSPENSVPIRRPRALAAVAGAASLALALGLGAPTAAASPTESPGDSPSPSPSTNPEALPEIPPFTEPDADCAESSSTVTQPPWTAVSLGLSEAHTLTKGEETTVAVLVTGLSADTPALSGAVSGGGGREDCHGYGTFLAGIVAARSVPDSEFTGVAPEAEVAGVGTGDNETGVATAEEIASSIGDAVDEGADVVLVGAAAPEGSGALDDAVADATADDVLVVAPATAAAQAQEDPYPGYPAQDSAVLSVGSYDPEGAPVASAPPTLEPGGEETGRTDVTAPGAKVMGVGPDGGNYVSGGDGVAAAFAAGTAALVRSREPDLSADQVRDRLMATAYGAVPDADTDTVGHGPIDPVGALTSNPEPGETPGADGSGFTATAAGSGSWDPPVTLPIVGVSTLLIVGCALGAVVLRRGRARRWRPAVSGEPISPKSDTTNG